MVKRFSDLKFNSSVNLSSVVLFLKGMAMGIGDSVPGVSGGTIAVITNIYERLVYALRSFDSKAVRLIISGQFVKFWSHIDGKFLMVLAFGILTGLLIAANTVLFFIEYYREPLMAFFIGLVLASVRILQSQYSLRKTSVCVFVILGALFALGMGGLEPRIIDANFGYIFFCGLIGICAMILPGISGAFILLFLGVYEFMLNALVSVDLPYIIVFIMGCILGILLFSRILAWLLKDYHDHSFGFISGVLVGSIYVLWPWQSEVSLYTDSSGIQQRLQSTHIWPLNYTEMTGNSPWLGVTVLAFLMGIGLVSTLNHIFNK